MIRGYSTEVAVDEEDLVTKASQAACRSCSNCHFTVPLAMVKIGGFKGPFLITYIDFLLQQYIEILHFLLLLFTVQHKFGNQSTLWQEKHTSKLVHFQGRISISLETLNQIEHFNSTFQDVTVNNPHFFPNLGSLGALILQSYIHRNACAKQLCRFCMTFITSLFQHFRNLLFFRLAGNPN